MKKQLEEYKKDMFIIAEASSRRKRFEDIISTKIYDKNQKIRSIANNREKISTEFNYLLGSSIKYISKRYPLTRKLYYGKNGITMARRSYCTLDYLKTKMSYDDSGIYFKDAEKKYYSNPSESFHLAWKLFQPDMVERLKDSIDKIAVIRAEESSTGPQESQIVFKGKQSDTILQLRESDYRIFQQLSYNGRCLNWDIMNGYRLFSDISEMLLRVDVEIVAGVIDDIYTGLDRCFKFVEERERKYKNCFDTIACYGAPFKMLKQIKES